MSVPRAMVQPASRSALIGGLTPRFAAIASLEGETYDRYYFAFAVPIRTNFMTNDPFVLADQGDNGELLVVIEDGYDYNGPGFTVAPIAELPATGPSATALVPWALLAVVSGFVFLASARRAVQRGGAGFG